MFTWAAPHGPAWQLNYFLALIRWHLSELSEARRLLAACGDEPRFAPFYAARAELAEDDTVRDLQRAAELDTAQWRYGVMLARHHLKHDDPAAALAVASDSARASPQRLAGVVARQIPAPDRPTPGGGRAPVLPPCSAAGAPEARALFHEAYLLWPLNACSRTFDDALRLVPTARQWPENLGSGKPYPADVDEQLEDWFTAQCQFASKAPDAAARQALDRILAIPARTIRQETGDLIRALALKQSGRATEAEQLLEQWQARDPGTELARWGSELFAEPPKTLPPSLKDLDRRVLAGIALRRYSSQPASPRIALAELRLVGLAALQAYWA